MSWTVIVVLAAGSYALKAIGPLIIGERASSPSLVRLAGLITPALLAALIAVQTFATGDDGRSLTIDARAVGLLVGAVAVWRRAPFVVVVIVAAAATAFVRALT
jgi:hypothetical protein